MPNARINGLNLHYQVAGEGYPVVLIHGLAANLAFWYLSTFWPLAKDFRTIAYDLRGHGRSATPKRGYATGEMVTDLQALLDHRGIGECHLVGHSYGGAIALHFATLEPQRVRSLTLADAWIPALRSAQPRREWRYRRAWERRLKQWNVSVSEETFRAGLPLLDQLVEMGGAGGLSAKPQTNGVTESVGVRSTTAQKWQALLKQTTIADDLTNDHGLTRDSISKVQQPTLAIFGRRSRWLGICEALEQSMPNIKVVMVPGAGHFHPLAKPAYFNRVLQGFLAPVDRRRHRKARLRHGIVAGGAQA